MEHPRLSARPVLPSPASSADQQHPTVSSPGCQGCPSPHTGQKYRLTSYWPGQASLATFPISKNKTILGWLLSFPACCMELICWQAGRSGDSQPRAVQHFHQTISTKTLVRKVKLPAEQYFDTFQADHLGAAGRRNTIFIPLAPPGALQTEWFQLPAKYEWSRGFIGAFWLCGGRWTGWPGYSSETTRRCLYPSQFSGLQRLCTPRTS